mmetsp:Transcript_3972/g.9211  ORF Transcript_3972/g.9211 Transcript_3972/m.9211 type:complete len:703 (+) Transcript_3972:64-2172(+)
MGGNAWRPWLRLQRRSFCAVPREFKVLRQDLDAAGGGSLLFEARDCERPWRRLRAETVVVVRPTQPWEAALGHTVSRRGATVCVSSQAGCPLDCSFCDTGGVKPSANLPAWAIVEQVRAAQRLNSDVRRVVFMGMGEPLLNYTEVSAAIKELQSDEVFSRPWSITLSTVGVVPRMQLLAADHPQVALAVSLHAPSQALRLQLVPSGAARWPLEDIIREARAHAAASGRATMFAYVILPGINDSEGHAAELASLLHESEACPFRPLVNLIPYNRTKVGDSNGFVEPHGGQLRAFRTALRARGVRATIRWSTAEGRPLTAACGQLTASLGQPLGMGQSVGRSVGQSVGQSGGTAGTYVAYAGSATLDLERAEKAEARALTRQLFLAATVEEVLALCSSQAQSLNPIHCSAAFVTLARSCRSSAELQTDPRSELLIARAEVLMPELSPQICANIWWALGKMRWNPRGGFLSKLAQHSRDQLSEFWPQNLAHCLWASATLRYIPDSSFLLAITGALQGKAASFTPVELVNSMWACAKLRWGSSSQPASDGEQLFATLAGAADAKVPFFKSIDIAKTLQAHATLRHLPRESLLQSCTHRALEKLSTFKPQELADTLEAFATLEHYPGNSFLAEALSVASEKRSSFSSRDLTRSAWALRRLGCTVDRDLSLLLGEIAAGTQSVADVLASHLQGVLISRPKHQNAGVHF